MVGTVLTLDIVDIYVFDAGIANTLLGCVEISTSVSKPAGSVLVITSSYVRQSGSLASFEVRAYTVKRTLFPAVYGHLSAPTQSLSALLP